MKRAIAVILALLLLSGCLSALAASKPVGDVNDDGIVNAKDVTILRRALAGGYGITLS